ncbi:MAG: hypothetical protein HGB22_03615 [Chlorobiaceae bacterium]|nr:hypothetical protein [Chlorobiaceae bacterium]
MSGNSKLFLSTGILTMAEPGSAINPLRNRFDNGTGGLTRSVKKAVPYMLFIEALRRSINTAKQKGCLTGNDEAAFLLCLMPLAPGAGDCTGIEKEPFWDGPHQLSVTIPHRQADSPVKVYFESVRIGV